MRRSQTETRACEFADVETWTDQAVLAAISEGQARAVSACRAAIPTIAAGARLLVEVWNQGGRVGYAGAGSSGLIAALDALELPVTYGMEAERLPIALAGGDASLQSLDQGSEDDEEAAIAAFAATGLGAGDAMIAVSASGATPFTLALARAAQARDVKIVAIACNPESPLLAAADIGILLPTGPEIVAGSTRMNAGTAQKCALNMLSTLIGIRLNHVYQGMMVNLRAENAKLRDRAAGIIARASGIDIAAATAHLAQTDFHVKPAILVAMAASPEQARLSLARTSGDLRRSIADLRSTPIAPPPNPA
jgi:N-acetylmuramic acid 6-phosphate etherase